MHAPIQIVILAGGLGTRLGPITQQIPKALVPIVGQPFIHHQLQWLSHCGIQEVILSTGHLGHMIQEFVKDGKKWNLNVKYVDEGKNLRGTAGAVRLIYDQGLLHERFLLTYGDSFLPIRFDEIWSHFQKSKSPALMTVLKNASQWDTSNVCFKEGLVTLYDKKANPKPKEMDYIDYGVSAFTRSLIPKEIPENEKFDLADVFHHLSVENSLEGYEVFQRFYEVGSPQGMIDFENYLKSSST